MATKNTAAAERTGSLGFESKLWQAADLLRNNMDPAEYKHVVLGLIFLKYIEDAFEARRDAIRAAVADPESEYYVPEGDERDAELAELLEDRDEFLAENVFWVPAESRWTGIMAKARQPEIGKAIDDAMDAIERENPTLKGVLSTEDPPEGSWRRARTLFPSTVSRSRAGSQRPSLSTFRRSVCRRNEPAEAAPGVFAAQIVCGR